MGDCEINRGKRGGEKYIDILYQDGEEEGEGEREYASVSMNAHWLDFW